MHLQIEPIPISLSPTYIAIYQSISHSTRLPVHGCFRMGSEQEQHRLGLPFNANMLIQYILKVLVVRGCFILLVDLVDAARRTAARLEGGVMHS